MAPKPVLAGSGYFKAKVQVLVRFCNIASREVQNIEKLDLNQDLEIVSFEN
jgi:hypothetical protein